MEGEGRPPRLRSIPEERVTVRDLSTPAPTQAIEDVSLEDVEDVLDDPPDSLEIIDEDSVDIEVDERGSVRNLLAMTGEGWSLDAQRDSLKQEAAKEHRPERAPSASVPKPPRPSVALPTPFDFGGSDAPSSSGEVEVQAKSLPPPLPPQRAPMKSIPPTGSRRPPPPLPRSETSGSARPPLPSLASSPPAHPPGVAPSLAPAATTEGSTLAELLRARVERLQAAEDKIGVARAQVELATVHEMIGDDARVIASAEAALKVDADLAPAHAILRRRLHSRAQLVPMLRHLERELANASSEAAAVELLAERARLLEAGDRTDDAREAWELALGRAPNHSAALKGLEVDLFRRAIASEGSESSDAWEDLVAHLGRMADAYSAQPNLAAWLHVERARCLEMRMGKVDPAKGAFERALRLDPGVGPVRDAFTLHCAAHHDSARLAALLAEEARMEEASARCARLELDAACITHLVLGDEARAIALLEQAGARAPTTPSVDRRVLDELIRLYERAAQWPEAARARRARLHFFTDTAAQTYELRRLANIEETLGNVENAIADIERAIATGTDDQTLVEELDRLLTIAGRDDERIALWHEEATRTEDVTKRAKSLARAAQLAEGRGLHDEALRHLRAAWVAAPGDSEVLDQLSRLMSPAPSERFDREVRSLIELYAQAAQSARDLGRRVAYLEKVALLWEELVGDPTRAARIYEEILRTEPGRRGAILGLGRTAGRIGDDRALSLALFEESKLAQDGADVLALRVRSAQALARVDGARAAALVADVLKQDPAHLAGRALETRLHEEAGRWESAARSIRARIDLAPSPKEKVALWLSLAQIQDARLRDPKATVASLQEARKLDPIHPVPPEEIARVLDATGDARELRVAVEQLAQDAITPQERARHFAYAAEIDELRLDDDVGAARLYARALAETPDDEMIADRLTRVLVRRVVTTAGGPGPRMFDAPAFGELLGHIEQKAARTTGHEARNAAFLHASLLVHANRDLPRATDTLERLAAESPMHVGVLRMLEHVARRGGTVGQISRAMKMQGDGFTDVRARLGALWELATLEAWRLPSGESVATYTRILELDPTDPSALEAAVRLALGPARRGDASARRAAIAALRSLSALAHDEASRIAVDLRLALLLELHGNDVTLEREVSLAHLREALERLREVLNLDAASVTAATMLARLANKLGDAPAAAQAAVSLAELSVQPKARAKYLVDAASLLLGDAPDDELGTPADRIERAAQLFEKALSADPNSTVAATRLAQVRAEQHRSESLVDVFRTALLAAASRDAIILLGSEIARVARDDLGDVGLAIEAMRKVRESAPDHVPSLLTLSELFIAQRAWPEAVDALEDVVTRGRESAPRITALFALASVYEKILGRPSDAERALRKALSIDDENPRGIRALIHRLAAKQNEPGDDGQPVDRKAAKTEIAQLLERLASVEKEHAVQCDILLELADIRIGLTDMAQAEKAIVDAVAVDPSHPRAFARLSRFFRSSSHPGGFDAVSYARALAGVIARGKQLGTQDARWFASLGHIEVEQLNRLRDGVSHLQHAIQIDPSLHESRLELATAFSRLGAHDDAAKTVLTMITPNAAGLAGVTNAAAPLELLERALNAERRQEEALVVSELRAIAGELDDGRHAWLRARRLAPFEGHHTPLDRPTLVGHVVPAEGRHVLLEVAAAMAGIETKLLRADLNELGISPRDRIGRRSGHPTRALLDRLARALNLDGVELVVTPTVARTRVIAQDALWLVVPKTLTELPEPTQLATIGRALARVALHVPWLEELPPPHIEAMLIAAARTVLPTYGNDDVDVLSMKLVTQYEPNIARELSRKQRQALEKLVPMLASPQGRAVPIDVLIGALARAELRVAYVLSGDALATIDELRGLDPAFLKATEAPGRDSVLAVLDHPFAGDVVRFALTPEATALRRRVASTWAG